LAGSRLGGFVSVRVRTPLGRRELIKREGGYRCSRNGDSRLGRGVGRERGAR